MYSFGGIKELQPEFRGGVGKLYEFISRNKNYSEKEKKGTVTIEFIIDGKGNVSHLKIKKGLNKTANAEALRVVNLLNFNPGFFNGYAKAYKFGITIPFNMEAEKPKIYRVKE